MDIPWAIQRMETFLVDQLASTDADGYVVGVSGGLDSAVATALAVRAVGADDVTGLLMPGRPTDPGNVADARGLCRERGVAFEEFSIRPVVDAVGEQLPSSPSRLTLGNVRARTRMVLTYAVANERELLVLGTGNRSERLLGYVTKYGDAAVDLLPMKELYKTEVVEVARALDLDERFVEKPPTAELWAGQTDEGEIGADYDTVDAVLRRLVDEGKSPARVAAETDVDRETVDHLAEMWRSSSHKRAMPPGPRLRSSDRRPT